MRLIVVVERISRHPLVSYLRDPVATSGTLNSRAWETLLGAARRGNLLSRSACLAADAQLDRELPEKIRFHFNSARRVAGSSRQSTLREIRFIEKALDAADVPCMLLKGAAYVALGINAGKGRLMSDVDIMVPHDRLLDVERALVNGGWMTTKLDPYDQRYYRQWMHELPPFRHLDRGTSLDVHHTILPPTALLKPDVAMLWSSAEKVKSSANLFVLSPPDMVLHSATHLFHEGEFPNGLRDLIDIDSLVREFSSQQEFWGKLLARAELLDLTRPLYYALKFCHGIAGTPIPTNIVKDSEASAPPAPLRQIMDSIVVRSIGSVLETNTHTSTSLSLFAMYLRSHYLRMPLHLLIPHLIRKQFSSEGR